MAAAAAVDALSFEGVLLLAKRNKKHRFFLAGRQNSFGGFIVGPVMLDSGCNSLLLPLPENQLATLGTLFPITDYRFGIAISKDVSLWRTEPRPMYLLGHFFTDA